MSEKPWKKIHNEPSLLNLSAECLWRIKNELLVKLLKLKMTSMTFERPQFTMTLKWKWTIPIFVQTIEDKLDSISSLCPSINHLIINSFWWLLEELEPFTTVNLIKAWLTPFWNHSKHLQKVSASISKSDQLPDNFLLTEI